MPCVKCKSKRLVAQVVIRRDVPFVERHGTVRVASAKIGQYSLTEAWDKKRSKEGDALVDKKIKKPIRCLDCGTLHMYVTGEKPALRLLEEKT